MTRPNLTRRRFLQVLASAPVAAQGMAAQGAVAAAGPRRWQGLALGAEAEITLMGGPRGAAEAALAELPALLAQVEAELSLYRPDSALSRLNATGRLADPPPLLQRALTVCDQLHRLTDGLFDPSVQPLWRALAQGKAPKDPATLAAAALIGWQHVRLQPLELGAGQALTLNGMAQGLATDAVRALLARHGFDQALVNIGEFAALEGPWRLGIADPIHGVLAERQLRGRAMATSSPVVAGRAHILHPMGGAAIWSTISVEAPDATLADGLSTALTLTDVAGIQRILSRLRVPVQVIAIDHAGNLRRFTAPAG